MIKLVEKAAKFFENLEKSLILHDFDTDGCCSAAIVARIIKEKVNKLPKIIGNYHHYKIFEKIERLKNFNNLIFCDIPKLDKEKINLLGKKKSILIIDHHDIIKFKNVVYFNPRILRKNIYFPTTYLAYKIAEKLKIKIPIWIVACGILADRGVRNCKHVFEKLKKENPELIKELKFDENFLFEKTGIGKITKFISNLTFYFFENSSTIARKLASEDDYKKFLADKKFEKINKKVEREIEKNLKKFEKEKVICGKFIYFEIKTKMRIKSIIANSLLKKAKNKILVVGQKFGKNLDLSFRAGANVKINLNEICKFFEKNVESFSGGGHEKAAGGRISYTKKEQFLNFLLKVQRNPTFKTSLFKKIKF